MRHEVEIAIERGSLGRSTWAARCSCGWSWVARSGTEYGQRLAGHAGADHIESSPDSIGSVMRLLMVEWWEV